MKLREFKVFHEIQQDLLKATEFHRISWNQQDLTQFIKSNTILLKATGFIEIQRFLKDSWDPTGFY